MRTVGKVLYVAVVLIFLLVLADAAKAQGGTISSFSEITSCTSTDLLLVERPTPNAYHFITCGNLGSSSVFGVAVDLSDNGTDEITRLLRINTSGDTNSIFTETVTDELTIDLSKDWPKADQADALAANGTNCSAGNYPLGVDAAGNAEDCTAAGGGASNSFETMNAPAGTDPVADSSTDTLNLAATGILTITGDSATDTLTFDATEVDGSTTNELQNLFQTVDAPAGTDPVADSTTDTLTLAASGIVTITGDSGTDTITIDATEVDGSTTNELQNLFQTISTTSGTAPVADSTTDTLTLTAGSGITITGDSGTDTVTIAATGGGTTITVQEDDSTVDGSTSTLDFTEPDATLVTSSPAGEANVDMSKYALLGGRSGGQTLYGGTVSTDSLKLVSDSAGLIPPNMTLNPSTGQITLARGATTMAIFSSSYLSLATSSYLSFGPSGSADACLAAHVSGYVFHDTDCDGGQDFNEDDLSDDDDLPDANEVVESMLKAVDAASDEDVFTYESTTGDFEWHSRDEIVAGISAGALPNDAVLEADLKVVDSPSDEEYLTYESTTGDFEWETGNELDQRGCYAGSMVRVVGTGAESFTGKAPVVTLVDAATGEWACYIEMSQEDGGKAFDLYIMFAPSSSVACNYYVTARWKAISDATTISSSYGADGPTAVASSGTAGVTDFYDTATDWSVPSGINLALVTVERQGSHASDTCSNVMHLVGIVLVEQAN